MGVVFYMFGVFSFKKQWIQFNCHCDRIFIKQSMDDHIFHYCFNEQWMWFSKCFHSSLSKTNGCGLPCVLTAHLISSGWNSICCHCCFTMQWMRFATCCYCRKPCHCLLNKDWMIFNMLSLLCTKHCMWFSTCCHLFFKQQ